mmetsp:Transcript_1934/g.6929  ORF Transcript_1934/g.6929 Transcript_1934/m.6929 type:complete len:129 (-) Transcript_1934:257-643(-)
MKWIEGGRILAQITLPTFVTSAQARVCTSGTTSRRKQTGTMTVTNFFPVKERAITLCFHPAKWCRIEARCAKGAILTRIPRLAFGALWVRSLDVATGALITSTSREARIASAPPPVKEFTMCATLGLQ